MRFDSLESYMKGEEDEPNHAETSAKEVLVESGNNTKIMNCNSSFCQL